MSADRLSLQKLESSRPHECATALSLLQGILGCPAGALPAVRHADDYVIAARDFLWALDRRFLSFGRIPNAESPYRAWGYPVGLSFLLGTAGCRHHAGQRLSSLHRVG